MMTSRASQGYAITRARRRNNCLTFFVLVVVFRPQLSGNFIFPFGQKLSRALQLQTSNNNA